MKIRLFVILYLMSTLILIVISFLLDFFNDSKIESINVYFIKSLLISIIIVLPFTISKVNDRIIEFLNKDLENEIDETIKAKFYANYIFGWYSIGGAIFVTEDIIMFKPHKFNIISKEFNLDLKDVEKIYLSNRLLHIYKIKVKNRSYNIVCNSVNLEKYIKESI